MACENHVPVSMYLQVYVMEYILFHDKADGAMNANANRKEPNGPRHEHQDTFLLPHGEQKNTGWHKI